MFTSRGISRQRHIERLRTLLRRFKGKLNLKLSFQLHITTYCKVFWLYLHPLIPFSQKIIMTEKSLSEVMKVFYLFSGNTELKIVFLSSGRSEVYCLPALTEVRKWIEINFTFNLWYTTGYGGTIQNSKRNTEDFENLRISHLKILSFKVVAAKAWPT